MEQKRDNLDSILGNLAERTKELKCIYDVEELLRHYDTDLDEICLRLLDLIPQAWQYAEFCEVRITLNGKLYQTRGFIDRDCKIVAEVQSGNNLAGTIEIVYIRNGTEEFSCPFLKEELQLLRSLSRKLGDHMQHRELHSLLQGLLEKDSGKGKEQKSKWRIVVDLLFHTDQKLYLKMARKMLNYLCVNGISEATQFFPVRNRVPYQLYCENENCPTEKEEETNFLSDSAKIFDITEKHLPEETILSWLQRWIQDDKVAFLVKTLMSLDSSLDDSAEAVRRFIELAPPDGPDISDIKKKEIRVLLTRRFVTNQLEYVKAAKKHLRVKDFYDLLNRIIIPSRSHGVIGGKASGLFLAGKILSSPRKEDSLLKSIAVPKTWYLPSDALNHFIHYNNMDDIFEQKYKGLEEIRLEYPHIIRLFKNSRFPPDLAQGLSMALDDLGTNPIIVRSSSRLEDRFGSAFSGKYKSLFLANQGPKKERLEKLLDAVAEVYSSLCGPDPLEYRAERGLLDVREEMGIIIQEVVGSRMGDYFLPAYAGIAFSSNEFLWSHRIKREDGLIRLVPGLGTRAVDRLSNDYPILIAPGQPDLRVNSTPEDAARYSPMQMDVINIRTNSFETICVKDFIRKHSEEYPGVEMIIGLYLEDRITRINKFTLDFKRGEPVVTFDGLIEETDFIPLIKKIMALLQEELNSPVDIEFASDGKKLYLLQCRPQSRFSDYNPSPIPQDIPADKIIFTAKKYISNGRIPAAAYIVYVDPDAYGDLKEREDLLIIGRIVSRLNKLLPKREFILLGPGRWGSRGDIKLGVNVGYSDINNTSVLIEIAKLRGNYVPDISFGTHFFQDLVESSIRYLPLYPDDSDVVFNYEFFRNSPNLLEKLLPEYKGYSDTVKVIDVSEAAGGGALQILFNADINEAVAFIS